MSCLLETILSCDKIEFDSEDVGVPKFQIDLIVEVSGARSGITIGRPYAGDEWRVGFQPKIVGNIFHKMPQHIHVRKSSLVFVRSSEADSLFSNYAIQIEIVGSGGESFRVFGDCDSFDVPCVKMALSG